MRTIDEIFGFTWLIDVDGTIYLKDDAVDDFINTTREQKAPYINYELVKFLKASKAKVIHFFTDYSLSAIPRQQLVKAETKELYRNDIKDALSHKDLIEEDKIEVRSVITNYDLFYGNKTPGVYYDEVIQPFEIQGSIEGFNLSIVEKYNTALRNEENFKNLARQKWEEEGYKSIKGPLFELIAKHFTFPKTHIPVIVVIDDNPSNKIFTDIEKAKAKLDNDLKDVFVITILAKPITEYTAKHYTMQLNEALKQLKEEIPEIAYECFLDDLKSRLPEFEQLGVKKAFFSFIDNPPDFEALQALNKLQLQIASDLANNRKKHDAVKSSQDLLIALKNLQKRIEEQFSKQPLKFRGLDRLCQSLISRLQKIEQRLAYIYQSPLSVSRQSSNSNNNNAEPEKYSQWIDHSIIEEENPQIYYQNKNKKSIQINILQITSFQDEMHLVLFVNNKNTVKQVMEEYTIVENLEGYTGNNTYRVSFKIGEIKDLFDKIINAVEKIEGRMQDDQRAKIKEHLQSLCQAAEKARSSSNMKSAM